MRQSTNGVDAVPIHSSQRNATAEPQDISKFLSLKVYKRPTVAAIARLDYTPTGLMRKKTRAKGTGDNVLGRAACHALSWLRKNKPVHDATPEKTRKLLPVCYKLLADRSYSGRLPTNPVRGEIFKIVEARR